MVPESHACVRQVEYRPSVGKRMQPEPDSDNNQSVSSNSDNDIVSGQRGGMVYDNLDQGFDSVIPVSMAMGRPPSDGHAEGGLIFSNYQAMEASQMPSHRSCSCNTNAGAWPPLGCCHGQP
eukprot:Gb_00161 [translate_table: standard]